MSSFKMERSSFAVIPKGEVVLKITKVALVPPKKPTKCVIDFVDKDGAKKQEKYNLAIKAARYYVSTYLMEFGRFDGDDLDTSDFKKLLEGKFAKCKVTHDVLDKVKDGVAVEGETVTFANIKEALSPADGFVGTQAEVDDLDDLDDEDDLDDLLDDLDADDEDDLPE